MTEHLKTLSIADLMNIKTFLVDKSETEGDQLLGSAIGEELKRRVQLIKDSEGIEE